MPIKWRGTSRRPIPDSWRSIGARSSPYHLAGNRNAALPVNAMFELRLCDTRKRNSDQSYFGRLRPNNWNYARGSRRSSKFIFDLMEPERPNVDRAVLDFVRGHVFDPADFIKSAATGVCRLNPEMARMVVAKVSA